MSGAFRTERLDVRPMTTDDVELIAALNADAEVMRHLTGRAMTGDESVADVRATLGHRWLVFTDDADGTFVGWVGAVPTDRPGEYDIGWRLRREAWGHGYASEVARALVDQLFASGAERVIATTMAVNRRSRAVMERIGLTYVRTFHLEFDDPLPGTEHGEVEYALRRSDWRRRSSSDG